MRKTITKIICAATALISAAGLVLASGCADDWTYDGVSPDASASQVESNGGFAVQTGDYVYFINGVEANTADNTFGTPLKGSIQRIAKSDVAAHNYTASQTVVPLVAYSTHYSAGIYIYGDRIYYSTPSTAQNSAGEVQNTNIEFKSSTLDGRETMSDYYYRSSLSSVAYRYVQPEADGPVYLLYAASESLYGEASAVTNIHAVNTVTREDNLLAYNVSSYQFDSKDPSNPYVFYTMPVTYNLGSDNAVSEGYNQLYVVRADDGEENAYDFSYVADYDREEDPLYVNRGDLVYDGIGLEANANRYSQFNYGYSAESTSSPYTVNRADTTYTLTSYKNGRLMFTAQQGLDASAGLYKLDVDEIDADADGNVDDGWDAVTANDGLGDEDRRLLTVNSSTDYTFVTLEGQEWALYNGEDGLMLGRFEGGRMNGFSVTDSGTATILWISEETVASSDGGTQTLTYVYYSLSGGTGYTFYRIALSTDGEKYKQNYYQPADTVSEYREVRILDLDANSGWYMPEFIDDCNTIIFASETEGMDEYNYIMACDISSQSGNVMSNAEIKTYNEQYEAVSEKIADYEEETNSDGSPAYENLSDALTYAFYTGDRDYLATLIAAYVEVNGEDEEYLYSKESAQIYLDFCDAAGEWEENYADDMRTVNGEEVHANRQQYYYALMGRMTEADGNALLESYRSTYLQELPVDNSTWWDHMGQAWQIVFIVAMCVLGLVVLAGIAVTIVIIVRRRKRRGDEPAGDKFNVDLTDDADIDVYNE